MKTTHQDQLSFPREDHTYGKVVVTVGIIVGNGSGE
jgi:hypothetical protein